MRFGRSIVANARNSIARHRKLFGFKGVMARALACVPGANREFEACVPNSSRGVIVRLGTTDVAVFEHVFINQEYGFSLARSPTVVIDAGANIGLSAVYFKLKYPKATIIAVEPEPSNFKILVQNAARFPGIIPINGALWNLRRASLDSILGPWTLGGRTLPTINLPQTFPSARLSSVRCFANIILRRWTY